MIEGMPEAAGMSLAAASWMAWEHREFIAPVLAKIGKKARRLGQALGVIEIKAKHRRTAGRHRLDWSKPMETRVDIGSEDERRVLVSEGTPGKSDRPAQRRSPGPVGSYPGTPGAGVILAVPRRSPRIPAGQARQRFARATPQGVPAGWITLT